MVETWHHTTANVIKALTEVLDLFASGKAASGAAEYCAGANLLAVNKKDGGIRPIAVGDAMRRLVSKCFAYSLPFPSFPPLIWFAVFSSLSQSHIRPSHQQSNYSMGRLTPRIQASH